MLTYSSPKHIGVRPVLHRLLVPRHPPCALSNLTFKKSLGFFIDRITLLTLHYPVFKEQFEELLFKTKQN